MSGNAQLAAEFESHRTMLTDVARRLLGPGPDADDAVQEAWLRLQRVDRDELENLPGWLTTVVSRISLDVLRSRTARREDLSDTALDHAERQGAEAAVPDHEHPERQAVLVDSLGPALLAVLDRLTPTERVAFVLHDVFAVPFDQIAPVVGRSTAATRQLASRGRRRVQGAEAQTPADVARQKEIVGAFLRASRSGDLAGLLRVLDPDVVLDADDAAVLTGATPQLRGAAEVAESFSGRAAAARMAMVGPVVGAFWAMGGTVRVVFDFTVRGDRITRISLLADPEAIAEIEAEGLVPLSLASGEPGR